MPKLDRLGWIAYARSCLYFIHDPIKVKATLRKSSLLLPVASDGRQICRKQKKPWEIFFPRLGTHSLFRLVVSDFTINSLLLLKLVRIKGRTSGSYAGSDQGSLTAADQSADNGSAAGSDRHIDAIAMPPIVARLPNGNPMVPSIAASDPLPVRLRFGRLWCDKSQPADKQRHNNHNNNCSLHTQFLPSQIVRMSLKTT
jgi:hypothetical protein